MTMIYRLHDAAVLATFYGQRGQLTTLQEHLIHTYQLIAKDAMTFVHTATDTLLLCFDPPATTDTSVLQLALNHPGSPQTAWPTMRGQLEALLDDPLLHWPVWGYSLVYQAMVADDALVAAPPAGALHPTLEALLPSVQRLHPPDNEALPLLAWSQLPGGQLSLHAIPRANDGVQAAIVYVALSTPDTHNQLVRQTLIGTGATLLMPDVIAHKAYHQIRQYHSDGWLAAYNHLVQTIRDHTQRLLQHAPDAGARKACGTRLQEAHRRLISRVVDLDALQLSLTQQDANYHPWLAQWSGDTAVLTFHQRHIQTALRELTILQQKGAYALNSAHSALTAREQDQAPTRAAAQARRQLRRPLHQCIS